MTEIFLKIYYIMGYNLKNARNGKSISKIPTWQSLRSLALKSKFVRQFEFLENLEYICGNSCWRARPSSPATFFHTNRLNLFKIQTVIKSHSLLPGASNLAILMFLFYFYFILLALPRRIQRTTQVIRT